MRLVIAIATMIFAALLGAGVGLIWQQALGTVSALYIATSVGGVLGVILGIMGIAATSGGRVNGPEGCTVALTLLIPLAMLGGAVGLVVWIIRAAFY